MADFESIIKKNVGEDGNIPASSVSTIVSAIKTAVGEEYVSKDRYKAKLGEIDTLKEKLQNAEDSVATAEKWKGKYEEEAKKYSDYKAEQDAKVAEENKKKAYNNLLKEVGISDKWLGRATKGVSFKDLELDKEGKIKNAEELKKSITEEWGDCIVTEDTKGAQTATPPANGGKEGAKGPSRAAQIAAQYHNDLYGSAKEA